MDVLIRDFDPARDAEAACGFIARSQAYEYDFEPDRRLDAAVGGEYLAVLTRRVAEQEGRIFIAEDGGTAIGWAVFTVEQQPNFVIEDERTYGYVAELFVEEHCRGRGIGRMLIAVCEDEARRRGLRVMMIGVLSQNARAAKIYQRAGYAPYSVELRKYL